MQTLFDFCTTDTSTWYGNQSKSDLILGPTNKKECPCDTCPQAAACTLKALSCKAFNKWSSTGTYNAKQIGKNLIAA